MSITNYKSTHFLEQELNSLIEEIIKQSQDDNDLKNLIDNQKLNDFIKVFLDEKKLDDGWKKDEEILNLFSELPNKIINSSNSGETKMTLETKIAIAAGGALFLIGIAIGVYYAKQKKKPTEETAKNIKPLPLSINNPFRDKQVTEELLHYSSHHLLLIIPANQSDGFENGQQINNAQVNKLIANSVRAYCFSGGKDATNEIAVGVKCDDEKIDNTTESRVFVHLLLSAEPSIIDERIRLNISDKIEPNTTIEIVKIAKLQTARSTTAFYEI